MADLPNLSLLGVQATSEALHEFKDLRQNKRKREKPQVDDEAESAVDAQFADDSLDGDCAEDKEHLLDVNL